MAQISINVQTRFATNLDNDTVFITGLIVRRWSMVEFQIDSGLRDFLNRSTHKLKGSTLKIPFKDRVAMLKQFFLDEVGNSPELTVLFSRIKRYENMRHLVAHGLMANHSTDPEVIYISRTKWTGKPEVTKYLVKKDTLLKRAENIAALSMALCMATAGCHQPGWTPYFDKWLLQDQSPIEPRT